MVSLVHVRCILDHIALTHAVDLSSKYFTHIKPRPCDRVDIEVTQARPGKEDKKEVVTHVGVRLDRLDRLEFTLWAAVVEHRISTTRTFASMWARIYKRADQLMQQENSTITHAIDTLLNEADLFRPVHSAGSSNGGGAGSGARSGGAALGPRQARLLASRSATTSPRAGAAGDHRANKYLHPSAMKSSGGAPRDEEPRRRSDRERDRPRSRSASASRGQSPSRSPERASAGRDRGSAATPARQGEGVVASGSSPNTVVTGGGGRASGRAVPRPFQPRVSVVIL